MCPRSWMPSTSISIPNPLHMPLNGPVNSTMFPQLLEKDLPVTGFEPPPHSPHSCSQPQRYFSPFPESEVL